MYSAKLTYILLLFPFIVFAQENLKEKGSGAGNKNKPVVQSAKEHKIVADSLKITADSLKNDSVKEPFLKAPITYSATDSIILTFDGEKQKVYMFNTSKINYQEIELSAYKIALDLGTKEVYAEGVMDTTETLVQKPVFKDKNEDFESKTLRYNFETEKGIIIDVVTEQGEGFVHSARTKKISQDAFILQDGKYTTCDAEHPHFFLHLSKAKVISEKKIITGKAYMVLEDFPIKVPFIPFGYFPSTPTYSSGILMPRYGEEYNRGFFLQEGGYYWAGGKYFDLAVTGDIYSKGSWGTKLHTNYSKKYKFSGNFDVRYTVNKYGQKGTDTWSVSPQFAINWTHSQDSKANPSRTFSANVNFSTSGYDRQNGYYESNINRSNYLRSQKSSSISFSKNFENTPFSVSVNARHSQNSTDTTISLSLPELTLTMAKIYPFRRKNRSGMPKFYEKFGFNYTANFRNSIISKEKELLSKKFSDWENGLKHNFPVALPSFNLAKYINISPGISYNEKWYFKKYRYSYSENLVYNPRRREMSHVAVETVPGLSRVYDYSYSLSASTNIYGTYLPLNPKSKVIAIRHKISPSFSFSYLPDFGARRFGYWQAIQIDDKGTIGYFDVNEGGVFGGSPSRGESGSISLSINNNLEAKVLNTKMDTTQTNSKEKSRIIKLIDNLSISSSYNLIADSLNMSPIVMNARTTIGGVGVNLSGTLEPYEVNSDYNVIHKYVWNERTGIHKLGRLTRVNLSFGMNFQSKTGKKEGEDNKKKIEEQKILPGNYQSYTDFNIPWSFGFDYSFNYNGPSKQFPKGKFMQSLGMRGQLKLTEKWDISMQTNFDIVAREFAFTTFNVTRDLHCWGMVFNFVPFGYVKSYSFTLSAKSSMLRNLKLQKSSSHFDNY